jgi:hypothetical protein
MTAARPAVCNIASVRTAEGYRASRICPFNLTRCRPRLSGPAPDLPQRQTSLE